MNQALWARRSALPCDARRWRETNCVCLKNSLGKRSQICPSGKRGLCSQVRCVKVSPVPLRQEVHTHYRSSTFNYNFWQERITAGNSSSTSVWNAGQLSCPRTHMILNTVRQRSMPMLTGFHAYRSIRNPLKMTLG